MASSLTINKDLKKEKIIFLSQDKPTETIRKAYGRGNVKSDQVSISVSGI